MNLQNATVERVMIIDDREIDRYVAHFALEKNNFAKEILEFDMAKKALEYLIANQNNPDKFPQVILLDIRMPGMDGFEFLEHISAMPQFPKTVCCVIMLSTSLSPDDHERALSSEFVKKFLNKPLNTAKLEEIKAVCLYSRK